jgi:4-amino-4-deoxy-L-arabinose transferase-like glycosyltransferase
MPPAPGRSPDNPDAAAAPSRPRRWRDGLLLAALCLIVYVPGFFTIPPVDRDESRFAQASRQMFESVALPAGKRDPALHSGGLVVPMLQDRARLNKPPLIYWLQAASAAVLTRGDPYRDAIWMYRVPSLLAAIAAVLMTWRLGALMFGEPVGVLAAALLAVCPVVAWEAHQARADMVLLAATTGAMAALWTVWARGESVSMASGNGAGGPGAAAMFWLMVALGVLTKGPITPLIAGLTIVALGATTRRWAWVKGLQILPGCVLVAAVVAPWMYLVARRVGPDLYFRTILDETLGRSLAPKEGHWAPPGYHLVLLPVLFWPGSLLTAAGIVDAFRRAFGQRGEEQRRDEWWRARFRRLRDARPSAELFCLAWIVPAWIVFELAGTKLPHYTMPMYPAIAILSARAVIAATEGVTEGAKAKFGFTIWLAIGTALCVVAPIALLSVAFGVNPPGDPYPWRLVGGAVLVSIVGAACLLASVELASRGPLVVVGLGMAAAVTTFVGLMVILPRLDSFWLSRCVAREIGLEPGMTQPVAAAGFQEDSLVFFTRGRLVKIAPDEVARWAAQHPGGVIVQPWDDHGSPALRGVVACDGFNYARGRVERLAVWVAAP